MLELSRRHVRAIPGTPWRSVVTCWVRTERACMAGYRAISRCCDSDRLSIAVCAVAGSVGAFQSIN